MYRFETLMMIYFGLDISFEVAHNYYYAYYLRIVTVNILIPSDAATLQKENLILTKTLLDAKASGY